MKHRRKKGYNTHAYFACGTILARAGKRGETSELESEARERERGTERALAELTVATCSRSIQINHRWDTGSSRRFATGMATPTSKCLSCKCGEMTLPTTLLCSPPGFLWSRDFCGGTKRERFACTRYPCTCRGVSHDGKHPILAWAVQPLLRFLAALLEQP